MSVEAHEQFIPVDSNRYTLDFGSHHSEASRSFVLAADDAIVHSGLVYTKCGHTLLSSSCGTHKIIPKPPSSFQIPIVNGTVLALGPVLWGGAFFHFIVEGLSTAVQAYDLLVSEPSILISWNKPLYERAYEYLELLGISRERMLHTDHPFRSPRVLMLGGFWCGMPPWPRLRLVRTYTWTRNHEQLLSFRKPDTISGTFGHCVVIHRKGFGRSFSDEVIQTLVQRMRSKWPHETFLIHSSSFSALETIKVMYQAKCSIGFHGAGLANWLYLHEGARVLEISPDHMYGQQQRKRFNGCFWWLANAVGLNYSLYLTPGTDSGYTAPLNLEYVLELVEKMLTY